MTAPHAFMRRDWFTCLDCLRSERRPDGELWCRLNDRRISWDPRGFGCGDYCVRAGRDDRVVIVPTLDHYHGPKTVKRDS